MAKLLVLSVVASLAAAPVGDILTPQPESKPIFEKQYPLSGEMAAALDIAKIITQGEPQLKATVISSTPSSVQASIQLSDGRFDFPLGSMDLVLPSEVQAALKFVEGSTGVKPNLEFNLDVVDA